MHVALKCFNEIARIVKSAAESDFRNRQVGCLKKMRCDLNTVMVNIGHRRLVREFLKIAAKVFWRHAGDFGELI